MTFTVADVPGLIEGASDGRGLGHDFLRHIERCAALVHVIDTASIEPGRNPVDDLDVIENELTRYGGLEDRPRLVALNKIDVPDGRDIAGFVVDELRERGLRRLRGLRGLRRGDARADLRDGRDRRGRPRGEARRSRRPGSCSARRRPTARTSSPSPQTSDGWRVRGEKPERWIRQTDFSNDEAVGFLADRLNRLGVETRLVQLGAEEGDAVLIGHPDNAVVFDFKPGIDAGAEILSRRGEDQRFDEQRPAHGRRRAIQEASARPGRGRDPRRRGPPAGQARDLRAHVVRDRHAEDPDWAENDPGATPTHEHPHRGDRGEAGRRQGRVLLPDHRRRRHRPGAGA